CATLLATQPVDRLCVFDGVSAILSTPSFLEPSISHGYTKLTLTMHKERTTLLGDNESFVLVLPNLLEIQLPCTFYALIQNFIQKRMINHILKGKIFCLGSTIGVVEEDIVRASIDRQMTEGVDDILIILEFAKDEDLVLYPLQEKENMNL
ncbi:hypothetical protein ACJX0J_016803, partial [Zea mays]